METSKGDIWSTSLSEPSSTLPLTVDGACVLRAPAPSTTLHERNKCRVRFCIGQHAAGSIHKSYTVSGTTSVTQPISVPPQFFNPRPSAKTLFPALRHACCRKAHLPATEVLGVGPRECEPPLVDDGL